MRLYERSFINNQIYIHLQSKFVTIDFYENLYYYTYIEKVLLIFTRITQKLKFVKMTNISGPRNSHTLVYLEFFAFYLEI